MFNDFTGGGQVFLNKVTMFWQVFTRTTKIALLVGIVITAVIHSGELKELDWQAFYSYRKAVLADSWDGGWNKLRPLIRQKPNHITFVDAKTKAGVLVRHIDPRKVMRASYFRKANSIAMDLGIRILMWSGSITSLAFIVIVLLWSRFGKDLKAEKTKDSANKVLTSKEVKKQLHKIGKVSDLKMGNMPLVKDMETRHFLVAGSTGSGKTNLIHHLLLQATGKKQPAVIIDQTGEMIAKYYNPARGDIIFNPFDERGRAWDFWRDCDAREDLERFSKILIGFNRNRSGSHSDPFWEIAAETVFNACAEFLRPRKAWVKDLATMACYSDIDYLRIVLRGTEAARYLGEDSKQTAASIAAVLSNNARPLTYLPNISNNNAFSLKEHFANIQNGSDAWLFLATKPSSRQLTLPLISCLTELALSRLMEIGIDSKRRVWVVMDELPSLGKIPALTPIMTEGRKYGACVLAGIQSLNQLYSNYGQYEGSTIFGQFATSFFFRNTEPAIAKMISSMCGSEIITRQQKNTSFGAHEFRDGVSYNEHYHKQLLVEEKDLASLAIGQCYVLLPEPSVRLSKIEVLEINIENKNHGFVAKTISSETSNQDNFASANANKDEVRSSSIQNRLAKISSASKQKNPNPQNLSKKDRPFKKLKGKGKKKSPTKQKSSLEARSPEIF
jgi:type IV conjugative transfer system coupling protein TraD